MRRPPWKRAARECPNSALSVLTEATEATGATDIAFKAIKAGEGMTETLTAKYQAAGMNKRAADDIEGEGAEDKNAAENAKLKAEAEAEEALALEIANNLTGGF